MYAVTLLDEGLRCWPVLRVRAAPVFIFPMVMFLAIACGGEGGTAVEDPAKQQVGLSIDTMQLVTKAHGWALTSGGLKSSADGGATWTDITPPGISAATIKGVFFWDAEHGWVVAPEQTNQDLIVFATADGGKTWASGALGVSDVDSRGAPAYIDFADARNGWIALKNVSSANFSIGQLFSTADGGATWNKLSIPIGDPISFVTATDGWTAGGPAGDKLYVSRNGGVSWQQQSVLPPPAFQSSYPTYQLPGFTSPQEGVLAVTFTGPSSGTAFYTTNDGGQSWKMQSSFPSGQPLHLGANVPFDVTGPSTWVSLNADASRVFVAEDGGKSLKEVAPNGLPQAIADLDFASSEIGWALEKAGECPSGLKFGCATISTLLKTTDGGQTWTAVAVQ